MISAHSRAQIRDAKARRAKLVEAEKGWIANGSAKKITADTVNFIKETGTLDADALKKLEDALSSKAAGAWRA